MSVSCAPNARNPSLSPQRPAPRGIGFVSAFRGCRAAALVGRLRLRCSRFGRDRSGQVTFLFGLMVLPILCAVGASLDYSRQRAAKVRLDAALDSAILAVASRKSNTFDQTEIQTTLDAQFRQQAAAIPQTTIDNGDAGFKVTVVNGVQSVTITAGYSAQVETTLTKLMRFGSMSVAGKASASRNYAKYVDFYLLLDNSPSMGLAATQADIDNMVKATKQKNGTACAFACHQFKSNAGVATENLNDNYYIAKNNNIKLRIDNLREATQSLVDSAKQTMLLPNQFRIAIYSFSDIQTKLSALTANLDQSKIEANKIQLEYSWSDQRDNQTSYIKAFPYISNEMPSSGDGLTASQPIRFLFFVTDGVQDSQIYGKAMTQYDKKVGSNRFIGAIDPALCTSLKNRGIRIGVIYTKYLPLDSGAYYNQYYVDNVKPFKDTAPANLQACASDGLYFPVETGGDINVAMQQLFVAAVNSVRLTN